MNKPPALSVFKTHDLYLAAAISFVCNEVPMLKPSDRGLISFSFTKTPEVLKTACDFTDALLEISALGFSNRIKQIRGDMMAVRRIKQTIPEEVHRDGK